jgi:hypothetical protein
VVRCASSRSSCSPYAVADALALSVAVMLVGRASAQSGVPIKNRLQLTAEKAQRS